MNRRGFATREISDENHRNALLDTGDLPLAGLNGAKRRASVNSISREVTSPANALYAVPQGSAYGNKLRGIRMVDQNRIEQGRGRQR